MQPKDMAFQPIPGLKTARFAGMSTFMRLPMSPGRITSCH